MLGKSILSTERQRRDKNIVMESKRVDLDVDDSFSGLNNNPNQHGLRELERISRIILSEGRKKIFFL